MTFPPRAVRLDLKCGKGAISKGEKCHKGAASSVVAGATLTGAAVAVGALALASRRRSSLKARSSQPGEGMDFLAQGTRGSAWASKDKKTVTKSAKDAKSASLLFEEARLQTKAHNAGVSTPLILQINKAQKTITMENLQGYKPLLTEVHSASLKQKAAYAKSLVVNLSKAHAADIAHGDLNTNILAKNGQLSIIDWGQASRVRYKGMSDILNAIRIADDLDPSLARTMKQQFKPLQAKFSRREQLTVADFNAFYANVLSRQDHSDEFRTDLKCGKGAISKGEKCTKGTPTAVDPRALAAVGLTAGALALGAVALKRSRGVAAPPRAASGRGPAGPSHPPSSPPPLGYLQARLPRQSKTQRMRANTAAAISTAEGRIAQTAREEVRRVGQIGNTMATTGEAAGMAVKTTLRELRLRTEAARRRFEPGYRRSPATSPKPPAQLNPGVDPALEIPFNPPRSRSPEAVPIDPRTGQPRRRQARGFGRTDNLITHYAPVALRSIQ